MKRAIIVSTCWLTLSGCTSIPQESVLLSEEITKEVTYLHEVNQILLSEYFKSKILKVRQLEREAVSKLVNKVTLEMDNGDSSKFGPNELNLIIKSTDAIHRNAYEQEIKLEKQERDTAKQLNERFERLLSASTSITQLLRSQNSLVLANQSALFNRLSINNDRTEESRFIENILLKTQTVTDVPELKTGH